MYSWVGRVSKFIILVTLRDVLHDKFSTDGVLVPNCGTILCIYTINKTARYATKAQNILQFYAFARVCIQCSV